jgi:hypothetical protein
MPDDTITPNPATMARNSFQNSFQYPVFEFSEYLDHVPVAKLMAQKRKVISVLAKELGTRIHTRTR